ncbi:MAG: DUF4266 domain-containing protein [Bacteroidota bacterium]
MNRKIYQGLAMVLFGAMSMTSCVSVKAWEKMYVNDADMALKARKSEIFEQNVETYREGAAGANGVKAGGGCGCN